MVLTEAFHAPSCHHFFCVFLIIISRMNDSYINGKIDFNQKVIKKNKNTYKKNWTIFLVLLIYLNKIINNKKEMGVGEMCKEI